MTSLWKKFMAKAELRVTKMSETLILRKEILELAEKHDIFNKQAVSRTVSQNYSNICGLRRTYHLMMSAVYGARPDKPYFFDICK